MNDYPLILWAAMAIFLLGIAYWVIKDKGATDPEQDNQLLDFLDQTGFSVQHLSTGWWAVTDSAQKVVGEPHQDVRSAVRSAVDALLKEV